MQSNVFSHTKYSLRTLEIVILVCSSSITESLTNFFAESFPQKLRQRDLELHITFSSASQKEFVHWIWQEFVKN
jgi:hypothetical protein